MSTDSDKHLKRKERPWARTSQRLEVSERRSWRGGRGWHRERQEGPGGKLRPKGSMERGLLFGEPPRATWWGRSAYQSMTVMSGCWSSSSSSHRPSASRSTHCCFTVQL